TAGRAEAPGGTGGASGLAQPAGPPRRNGLGISSGAESNRLGASPGARGPKPPPPPTRTVDEGTLFLKIAPDKEKPTILHRLQSILKKHPGRSNVALFYERSSRLLELNVDYRVEVTTVLTKQLERLLGEGAVKRK
ncbi:MAG TPA: hypothetical protein VEZ72_24435, partial [Paenibacillus sp.]|nr:hypothetical protein [Paenibacillus sp.]